MPAVLAGLSEEAILALAYLALVCSFLLAFALLHIWQLTFQPILRGLEYILPGGLKVLHVQIFPDLKGKVRWVESQMHLALQGWLQANEIAVAGVWRAMGDVWKWNAGIAEWLAKETAHAFEWLIHVRLGKLVKLLVAGAFPAAYLVRLITNEIRKHIPGLLKFVHEGEHVIEHTIPNWVKKAGPYVLPGTLGIPRLWKEIHGLTKRNARTHWRLNRLELLLGASGMAVAMARALGLPNWRCVTRGNVGRVARHLCGLPSHVLDDLLGLLVDVLLVQNVCQVVSLLSDGLHIIQGPIDTIVGEVGGSLCDKRYLVSPTMGPFTLSTPPVTGYVLQ